MPLAKQATARFRALYADLVEKGRTGAALDALREIVKIHPLDADARSTLAKAALAAGDVDHAREFLDENSAGNDPALLLAGILDAKQFFNGATADEIQIRALADAIYQRVNWPFVATCPAPCCALIYMGWKPGTGFGGFGAWTGYNAAMIL